jgi:hypothetical protein
MSILILLALRPLPYLDIYKPHLAPTLATTLIIIFYSHITRHLFPNEI